MASRPVRVAGMIALAGVRVAWLSTMILVPAFGFWLASSLAAYSNASQWLALLVGLLLFPLVPMGWDLVFVWRRNKRTAPVKAILTRLDRLVLRTLVVNGVFLSAMLWRAPETSFRALSVRGDWILDGHHGRAAEAVRGFLLDLADLFERRWHHGGDEYGKSDKPPGDDDHGKGGDDGGDGARDKVTPETDSHAPRDPKAWPMTTDVDPIVTSMPESAQTSVEAVGQYLAARITDKRVLVKALHDYVVLRLTYDDATFRLTGEERYTKRPSQQAEDVFAARTAVCEGYARLMVALGTAAGVEIAYLTGSIRTSERRFADAEGDEAVKQVLDGYLHAWNAVKLDGTWYLLDATWDDPTGGAPTLRSTYLLTPPKLFRYDHLPDEPAWQLVAVPLSAGEFARQPLLTPAAGGLGLTIDEPTRSQITVDDNQATVVFDNPLGAQLLADATPAGVRGHGTDCTVRTDGAKTRIACPLGTGAYEVRVFGVPKASGTTSYPHVGTILVNSR